MSIGTGCGAVPSEMLEGAAAGVRFRDMSQIRTAADAMMPRFVEVAIIGAGPYGLSLAAHLSHAGVSFRIFGKPLSTWRHHMPKGMHLNSDGFASNISSP